MPETLNDLRTFVVVAQTGSFTKASAQLGVSTSAVSHLIKNLEKRLQLQLFHRTTRSIAPTAAGEQLYRDIAPLLEQIAHKVDALSQLRGTLRGALRISGADFAFVHAVWDRLHAFMRQYPEVQLELNSNMQLVDIVQERFDAGIRLGNKVEKDMIAVRIAPDYKMCLAASPAYLAQHGTPQTPQDLAAHQCIAVRMPTSGAVLSWEFQHPQTGERIKVQPQGQVIANSGEVMNRCAVAGLGLVWRMAPTLQAELQSGALVEVLADWAVMQPGCFLYYPNRSEHSPLLKALVAMLRV